MTEPESTNPAFEALYDRSVEMVYSYARNRLGPSEGEDVAAEVFQAALIALRAGKAEAVTEAWLMAVARNKVIDRWRASERRMRKAHLLARSTDESPPGWSVGEDSDRLRVALDSLEHRYRALLILHYVDGYPMASVAEQLGESLEAARSAIARARRALIRAYKEVNLDV